MSQLCSARTRLGLMPCIRLPTRDQRLRSQNHDEVHRGIMSVLQKVGNGEGFAAFRGMKFRARTRDLMMPRLGTLMPVGGEMNRILMHKVQWR